MNSEENNQQDFDNRRNYNNREYYNNNGCQRPPRTPQPVSGMSIAALILGALSIVCSCCGVGGIIFGALGIIIAVMSKGRESMQTPSKIGLGLSIAGLILGIILTVMLYAFSSYMGTEQRIQSFEYEISPHEEIPSEEYPDDSYRYYDSKPQEMPYSRDLQDLLNQNQPQAL